MAKDETKRINACTHADDEAAFNALEKITGYSPSNPNYAITALTHSEYKSRGPKNKAQPK